MRTAVQASGGVWAEMGAGLGLLFSLLAVELTCQLRSRGEQRRPVREGDEEGMVNRVGGVLGEMVGDRASILARKEGEDRRELTREDETERMAGRRKKAETETK